MKKTICLTICLLVVAVAGRAQSPKPSWKTYVMKEADLSFTLPIFPSTVITKDKREASQPYRQRHVFDSSADGVDYTVFVVENQQPRQSLDEFIKQEKNSKWDTTTEREVTVDGITGKMFVYRNGKGVVQFFATKTHLLGFRAQGARVDDPRLTKFFSAIALKKIEADSQVSAAAGSSANSGDKAYQPKDVDSRVEIKSRPDVAYTSDAEDQRITGTVILRCIFTSEGTVTNIQVVKGLPHGLTEKAIEAAKKIKFVPATKNGRPVSMWMQLEYNFDMYDIR